MENPERPVRAHRLGRSDSVATIDLAKVELSTARLGGH